MEDLQEPLEIAHWKRISILGSGAFGVVSLWQHKISDDYIAIKKCRFHTSTQITPKQRQRWENEVQIMKNLNCPNIVSFKPIPQVLETVLQKFNPTKLPLLSMEYCMRGNLRHLLTQVKNLSGLQEDDVKVVLSDITTGVAFLHHSNITHRDIKPENIVLQQCDIRPSNVIYKLIDLGYAKELEDTIVSFVGTLNYLAPEIFRTEKYNCSVDYWSLGIVAFEIISGILPFLPQYTPIQRFPYIEKKEPDQICIYQLHSGSVVYSSELLKENHISRCLQHNIEIWLRRVLEFNPELRGNPFDNNLNVFEYLHKILQKKILTVFCVFTLEFYSYEIDDSILTSTLKEWIARDTKVQKCDQVLLSNRQTSQINDDKYVIDIVSNNDLNLYVFKIGAFINKEFFKIPKYIKVLFENCNKLYKWPDLRPMHRKSLYFLTQEDKLLNYLKNALNLSNRFIEKLHINLKDNMRQIYKTVSTVLTRVDCYHNLQCNRIQLNCVNSAYQKNLEHYQQFINEMEKCISNTNELLKRVEILCQRQLLLHKVGNNVNSIIRSCDIKNELSKAAEIISKESNTNNEVSPKDMVRVISNALKNKDKLLNNKNFQCYYKATLVAIKDVEVLQHWMEKFHKHVRELSKNIDDNQKEQYQNLLIFYLKYNKSRDNVDSLKSDNSLYLDTNSIIKENQEWRCKLEEVFGEISLVKQHMYDGLQTNSRILSEFNINKST